MTDPIFDGFMVARSVFDAEEIAAFENVLSVDAKAAIALVMAHPDLLAVAHDLVGPILAQTGEIIANFEPKVPVWSAWHYDSPWQPVEEVMPIWRFGIYFRDYTTHSGGLAVVPGSHLGPIKTAHAKAYAVPSRPGDVVVWNLRLLHAADADNNGLPRASPRNAIFFDYGAPGPDLDRYVAWRKEKKARNPEKARA